MESAWTVGIGAWLNHIGDFAKFDRILASFLTYHYYIYVVHFILCLDSGLYMVFDPLGANFTHFLPQMLRF